MRRHIEIPPHIRLIDGGKKPKRNYFLHSAVLATVIGSGIALTVLRHKPGADQTGRHLFLLLLQPRFPQARTSHIPGQDRG